MKMTRRAVTLGGLNAGVAAGLSALMPANAQSISPSEARQIAEDAYVYGYSLITTEVTRVQSTNRAKPEGIKAPLGQFGNVEKYPPADFRLISAPNADTLYSFAWLDLIEPQVFSHPDMGDRYYIFEVVDLWMSDSKSSPSTRTADGKAANYLFTAPGWKGEVPAGMKHFPSATRYMIIAGRIYADGSEQDYKIVNALQAQNKITPLSAWGKPYTPVAAPVNPNPGFSMTDAPQSVILAMGTEGYFNLLAKLMAGDAPPAPTDGPILARMAQIGIEPGKAFVLSNLAPAIQAALKDIPQTALKKIEANKNNLGSIENGWAISKGLGTYGPGDYLKRATVAAFGWPANQEKDAVYPITEVDSSGQKLTGANKYTVTFAKGEMPPVKGFWSITIYMIDKGWWFTPNPLNKFTVSARDKLKANPDGSTTLYFQNKSPGADKESNWLPTPKGDFIPMMRMYYPSETSPSIINGTWKPPQVIKVR
ncbi:DUF1254 domain-containing protein [Variovorax sp. M-6]|uniref:DUF1254 domain-containing protein n=1 Tax=Variovorax sp. M-6 TaxID=3233041 RepID=UPI003F972805